MTMVGKILVSKTYSVSHLIFSMTIKNVTRDNTRRGRKKLQIYTGI